METRCKTRSTKWEEAFDRNQPRNLRLNILRTPYFARYSNLLPPCCTVNDRFPPISGPALQWSRDAKREVLNERKHSTESSRETCDWTYSVLRTVLVTPICSLHVVHNDRFPPIGRPAHRSWMVFPRKKSSIWCEYYRPSSQPWCLHHVLYCYLDLISGKREVIGSEDSQFFQALYRIS